MIRPHIATCRGQACLVDLDQGAMSVADWDLEYARFQKMFGVRGDALVDITTLYPDQCHAGVYWDMWICGPQGAYFQLYPMENSTKDDVKACRAKIFRDQDVVKLYICRIRKWHHLKQHV